MKKIGILLSSFFYFSFCIAQRDSLYVLEKAIIKGDETAFRQLAKYLDSSRIILDPLGYHQLQHSESSIARRIFSENCLFLPTELQIDSSLTTARFIKFLDTSHPIFDDTTGEFLITALGQRSSPYRLRALSSERIKYLDSMRTIWTFPDWRLKEDVRQLIGQKDPQTLWVVASAWYYTRTRYNSYIFLDDEFLGLMQVLTHEEVAVPDQKGDMSFLYKVDYFGAGRLNYLIYWVNHYKNYKWDDRLGYFTNTKEVARSATDVERYFQMLGSKNDSIAFYGFTHLSESPPDQLDTLLTQYDRNDYETNDKLPSFTYRFLKQMSPLTKYCRERDIQYTPSLKLTRQLNRLLGDSLAFPDRYQWEENLAKDLSLEEITAVEYFGLLYEKDWDGTYSIGRIIDKFYSIHWPDLVRDTAALQLYLKKSRLYDDLGIIGNCNKYLRKFENCSPAALQQVKELSTSSTDEDIKLQVRAVITQHEKALPVKLNAKKRGEDNDDYKENLHRAFKSLHRPFKDEGARRWAISQIIGKISYEQLGTLLRQVNKDTILKKYSYDFLEKDFGFGIKREDSAGTVRFLQDYETLTEYQLYEKYLKKVNPAYYFPKDSFDYKKVYEILKYDVVDAFVGGGGSRREPGVYLLIKLLELKFDTRLGFPRKLCNSQGLYGCNCTDRARYWMQYLVNHGLVKTPDNDPPSISY